MTVNLPNQIKQSNTWIKTNAYEVDGKKQNNGKLSINISINLLTI